MHAVMQGSRRMVAANIAGGTHHAFAGHGEGFCKKYLVTFLLLSLKLLPNFFIHVDVTTEVYMLHQLIENVRRKQNWSSWICKHQLENCKHLGSLTWVQVCSMTLLLLQRCHCGIILTFAILNHQSSSLTLMSIRLVKQLSIHFTSQSTTSTDLWFLIPKDQRSSFNCFLLVFPIVS